MIKTATPTTHATAPTPTTNKHAPAQTGHTPGPWIENDGPNEERLIVSEKAGSGFVIATIPSRSNWLQADADWHLIAAAPALLQAARESIQELELMDEADLIKPEKHVLTRLRAAIALAQPKQD